MEPLRTHFNPHSPCGERLYATFDLSPQTDFNPHSPCGERPQNSRIYEQGLQISIHTPHAGSDQWFFWLISLSAYDFNPHSPCGERRQSNRNFLTFSDISIHTPHAGSDLYVKCVSSSNPIFQSTLPMRGATCHWSCSGVRRSYFNPHSPCGERLEAENAAHRASQFQSTLPMRGATSAKIANGTIYFDFNPHSPCGERRGTFQG